MNPDRRARTCVVAGAAGGIGSAVVVALRGAGFAVAGIDIDPRLLPRCESAVAADLTDADAARDAVERAATELDGLDAVVNAVGASGRRRGDGPIDEVTDDGWRWTLGVNLDTTFHMCRAAIPHLRRRGGGAIVNISSVLGLGGDPGFTTHAYAASKGAVIALTRSMAVTYAPDRIRVNVVCPGLIETPMSTRARDDTEIQSRLVDLQPLTGQMGKPDDVAGAVHYLVSDQAAFVTGATLTVDGGWAAR